MTVVRSKDLFNFTFDGSQLLDDGSISGSSTFEMAGATTLGSSLEVSGALTFAGPASGSVAGPGSYLALT